MRDWNSERAKRLAKQRQRQQLAITEATSDLVATMDIDGFLISLNQAGYDLLGLEKDANISLQRFVAFYTEENAENFLGSEIPRAIENDIWLSETTVCSVSGENISSSQVLIAHKGENNEVSFFSIILRDMRPIKKAEKERIELVEQLHQAKKMETIGRLSAGIAHDFNNILTVIMGYSELGLSNNDIAKHDKDIYEKILNSSEKAARLSHQLLDFSSKQLIEPKVLNLNEIIRDSQELIERLMGEEIELEISLDSALWPIKIDHSQLEQVIINLAANARDALLSDGKFTLTTKNICLSTIQANELKKEEGAEYVLLTVSDTGSGISTEIIDHIFEPFYTTKKSGEGTGLGLSAVYGAIKQNDGHISVTSDDIAGTSFNIYLPRVNTSPSLTNLEDSDVNEASSVANVNVLLVEDNPEVRSLLVRILTKLNHSVLEAKNSDVALEIFKLNSSNIDLVISDVVMPKMDGIDLSRSLRIVNPEIKILLISGHTDRITSILELKEGNVELLTKPFSTDKLDYEIRKILGKV